MALSIVGAGFGRTGTLAAKLALEKLGFNPCYHMIEVFSRPTHVAMWTKAAAGQPVDWDVLFEGFAATVDWPACYFWRELVAHYPAAKVLLTVRDPERWYESARNTIFAAMTQPIPGDNPLVQAQRDMAARIVVTNTFGGRIDDRAHAIAVYQRHNETVRRAIPPDRLLVFDVAQGWEPLCRFLDRPIPAEPFPRVNSTSDFRAMFGMPNL